MKIKSKVYWGIFEIEMKSQEKHGRSWKNLSRQLDNMTFPSGDRTRCQEEKLCPAGMSWKSAFSKQKDGINRNMTPTLHVHHPLLVTVEDVYSYLPFCREDIRLSETRLNKRYNRNSQSSSYESPLRQLSIAEENEEVSEPVHSQGISHQGQTNQGFQHTPRTSIQRNGSLVRPDHSNVQPLHRAYSVQPRVHYDQTALHRETPANRMLDRSLSIEHSVPPLEHSTPKLHRTHSYQPDRVLSARSARQLKELRGEYDTSL